MFKRIVASIHSLEFRLLKKRANDYGYELTQKSPLEDAELFIENFFKTSFQRNALLSYVVFPFKGHIESNHSNNQECFAIAELIRDFGFNVDIINWNNNSFLPKKKYNLVIDNHNNLDRLNEYFSVETIRILHATNAFWLFQNFVEYSRCESYFSRTGIPVSPSRVMPPGNSAKYCDAVSMFGNDFTKHSYGVLAKNVHHLPMSVTTKPQIIEKRKLDFAKYNFLWLNSHGALLKGLDILVESFSKVPYVTLSICGNLEIDEMFKHSISSRLSPSSNIKYLGWINVESEKFLEIVSDCAWVVSASFSEGGGGSILNCMAKGLIPIISNSTSITLPADTGFTLKENNTEEWTKLIEKVITLPVEVLEKMSVKASDHISLNHTLANFKSHYKTFLKEVLSR